MSAPIDVGQLVQVFLEECEDGLDSIAESLIALEADAAHPDARHAIFRVAHTVKGGAAIVGFTRVAEYAHLLEDALEPLRSDAAPIAPTQVSLLLRATDTLRGMIAAEAAGRDVAISDEDRTVLAQLAVGSGHLARAGTHATASAAGTMSAASVSGTDRRRGAALRVGMDKLDAMLTLSGEIAVAQQRMRQQLDHGASREETLLFAEELDRVLGELQERVMQLRLVELGPVFRPHLRTVRDIAAMQGKQVRLVIEGEDVEVDASIVDQLRDPLLHMVRNAVDHGVEPPAERLAAGKPACATVALRAWHERGMVVITIEDDGGGLRRARLLATARERGRIAPDAEPADAELHAMILEPGFSTAATVTQLSGRGVGMDVVRQHVESLRGTLSLRSVEGRGTTITLRLPLTIAIIDGFLVGVGEEHYVIPADAVCECLAFTDDARERASGVVNLRGGVLPYTRLAATFGTATATVARANLVVVQHDGRRFGLVVDRLLGERQVVLKPLDRLFDRVPGVSGSTILGDGRVSLILDMAHLASVLDDSPVPALT